MGLCRVHSHERTWRALSVTSQGKRGPEASVIIIFGGVNISVEKKKKKPSFVPMLSEFSWQVFSIFK